MLREGANKGEIARALYRDKSTIKREIRRGSVEQRETIQSTSKKTDIPLERKVMKYFAEVGERRHNEAHQRSGAKNKMAQCGELIAFAEEKILGEEKWSPDAVLGYAGRHNLFCHTVCTKTMYNWIDAGLLKVKNIDLLLKVRRKPSKPHRERKRRLGKSIDERPKEAEAREEFGHWEGDGIVGKEQQGHLISLVERKTGVGMLFNVVDKKDNRIVGVLDELQKEYKTYFSKLFKTITFDNGTEFARSNDMEREGRTAVYYAHPYSSWERGTNENRNGIVRRFVPKGKSFDALTEDSVARIAYYINTLPRKRFGYKTPLELWEKEFRDIL